MSKKEKMSKGLKYIIIALIAGAVLMIAFYFLFNKKEKEYIITFDSNGGSVVLSQNVKEGNKVIKPTDPTKEKNIFVRWEYQNIEYDFNKEVIKDMTLKAIWIEEKEEIKYDITFNVNGKTKTISASSITDIELEELGFEEKNGYILNWYLDGKLYDLGTPLTENMTLTGKYEKITTYTVKFNSDGGTTVALQKLKLNEKVKEPSEITKYGFIFDGWYLNGKEYDFSTPVTKNITLVAKWKEDSSVTRYEVTFDSDGGSSVSKQRVIENQTVSTPKNPTLKGYTFVEWQLDGKKYDFKTKVTKNIKLKAKWEKIVEYTVIFNKNNGSTSDTVKVTSGEKVTKPSDPTKEGYVFVEWLLNNKTYDFNTAITSDITLTARYALIKEYTVTFNSNGGSNVSSQKIKEGQTANEPNKPTKDNNDFVEWQLNGSKYDFNTKVTKDIELVAKWKEKVSNDVYTITATRADRIASPDSILTVKKNGTQISVKEVKLNSGIHLCYGSNLVVTTDDIEGQTSLIVILNDGNDTEVKAALTIVR